MIDSQLFGALASLAKESPRFRVAMSLRYFYDAEGHLAETVDMVPGGVVLNIEAGQWHSLKCLESGTVLLEAKDGAWKGVGGG